MFVFIFLKNWVDYLNGWEELKLVILIKRENCPTLVQTHEKVIKQPSFPWPLKSSNVHQKDEPGPSPQKLKEALSLPLLSARLIYWHPIWFLHKIHPHTSWKSMIHSSIWNMFSKDHPKGEDNGSITTLNLVKGTLFKGFDQWQVIGVCGSEFKSAVHTMGRKCKGSLPMCKNFQ
jgi:hypothetical protein